jgi:hypothetical protein
MLGHRNFVNKTGAQSFNRPPRGQIIGIAGDSHRVVNGTHERRNGATRLERITMSAMLLANLETNVPRRNSNVFSIANAKINMANIRPVTEQYAEMVCRNEITGWVTGHYADEMQSHLAERQSFRGLLQFWCSLFTTHSFFSGGSNTITYNARILFGQIALAQLRRHIPEMFPICFHNIMRSKQESAVHEIIFKPYRGNVRTREPFAQHQRCCRTQPRVARVFEGYPGFRISFNPSISRVARRAKRVSRSGQIQDRSPIQPSNRYFRAYVTK